jgi:hypothetical protein
MARPADDQRDLEGVQDAPPVGRLATPVGRGRGAYGTTPDHAEVVPDSKSSANRGIDA